MSGSAAGGVGVLVGVAVVAPVVIAAGCAYGLAKTTQFLLDSADEAWEAHERIQEIRRLEAKLATDRYQVYLDAQAEYDQIRATIMADHEAGGSQPVPEAAPVLAIGSELADLQQATADLTVRAAALRRERQAAATILLARTAAQALQHVSTMTAHDVSQDLDARAASLVAERRAAESARQRGREERAAAALAAVAAESLARADARAATRISELLLALPSDVDADIAARVTDWVERSGTLSGEGLDTAVYALEGLVDEARARSDDRALYASTASGIKSALAGCDTEIAKEILARIDAYIAGTTPWDPELVLKAQMELERVQQEFCDLTAAAVLATALEDIGYEVGEGFRTQAAHGMGFAHRKDWPHHVLQVSTHSGNGAVALKVVRVGSPATTNADREEDESVEHALCADLDLMAAASGESGVPMAFPERLHPGTESVPSIDAETLRYLERETPA